MRLLDFFDGAQSETAPTIGNLLASGIITYPDDATYEATEQGAPIDGNIYYNTTTNVLRYYSDGAWSNIVDDDSLQTLVNKTIDADLNTIRNLEDDNIKSGAGINVTKLHDGSVDNTEFGHLDGVTSPIQTQIDSKVNRSGDTMTGTLTLSADPVNPLDASTKQYTDTKIDSTEKGTANGVAELDGAGLVPASQLPSYVDDVLEFADFASFPVSGETGKIYIAIDTGNTYRWSGSSYVQISASGANQSLSNLTNPTSVNQDLLPETTGVESLGGPSDQWNELHARSLNTGNLYSGRIGDATNADSATGFNIKNTSAGETTTVESLSDGNVNSTATGDVYLLSGNKTAGTGDSGDINIKTGTSAGGNRGKIKLKNGTEGTAGQVWTSVGIDGEGEWAQPTGGEGSKNYIDADSAKLEENIGSWSTDDGASSPSSVITLTQNTTTPLSGNGDLSYTKSAANGNGHFAKVTTQPIDRSDRGGILFFRCNIDASDSNYANNLEFEFYDNTNSAVLYAGSGEDLVVSKGQYKFTAHVYLEDTTAEIEVRIKINDTDATAYTVYFDDFAFGPAAQVQTVYRKSQVIDLTGSGDFTGGEIQVERVGNIVSITSLVNPTFSSSAIPSSATGLLPEWARPVDRIANAYSINSGSIDEVSATELGELSFEFRDYAGAGDNQTSAIDFSLSYVVPETTNPTLTETQLSLQTVKVSAAGNNGSSITSNTTDINFTEVEDLNGVWNGSVFTARRSGYYMARGVINTTASVPSNVYSYIDGIQDKFIGINPTGTVHVFSWKGYLDKNQQLSFRLAANATLNNNSNLHWIEISSQPDYTVLGAVRERNRYVTKFLTGDQTSDGVMSDLTVNGLVIGKHYELKHHFYVRADAADTNVAIDIENGGTRVGYIRVGNGSNSSTGSFANHTPGGSFVFKATATSLTFEAESLAAGTTIFGNNSTVETFIQVVERNDLIETSDF